jgi:hypothetical protein
MANVKFYATEYNSSSVGGTLIQNEAGSGIGLYGAGYGVSVPIGGKQDTTWLTNSNGTAVERIQLNNTKYTSASTVSVNGASAINLGNLPNNKAPLNIRFEHTSAVRVQNVKVRSFDRNDIDNHASGVSTFIYETRHPSSNQALEDLAFKGRSEETWFEFDPAEPMADMPLTNSPGVSGVNTDTNDTNTNLGYLSTNGSDHVSIRHDWYLAMSCEPHTIGSKLFGLYFSCEYL